MDKKPLIQKTLDIMLGKSLFLWLVPFIAIDFLIKFTEQLRWLKGNEYTALQALCFSVLSLPTELQIFLPSSALLGSLWGLAVMERSQMHLAMQSLGISEKTLSRSTRALQNKLSLSLILPLWFLAPWCEQKARCIKQPMLCSEWQFPSKKTGGWIKVQDALIHVGGGSNNHRLHQVTSYQFTSQPFRLETIYRAQSAVFCNGSWSLQEVEKVTFDLQSGKPITSGYFKNLDWNISLPPERLQLIAAPAETLSISALYWYSNESLVSNAQRKEYRTALFNRLCLPIRTAVMIWCAQVMHRKLNMQSSLRVKIGLGFGLGIAVHVSSELARSLLELYEIHPLVGELLPVLSLYVLFKLLSLRRAGY